MTLRGLAIALALAAAAATATGCNRIPATPPETAQSIVELRAQVASATGHRADDLEVTATSAQVVVSIINSPLASHPAVERENEARRVISAVVNAMSAKTEFGAVHTIHVDYVARDGGGARKIVDRLDFRKDASGAFQHHLT